MEKSIKAKEGTEARRLELEGEIGQVRREYDNTLDLSEKKKIGERLLALELEYAIYYND